MSAWTDNEDMCIVLSEAESRPHPSWRHLGTTHWVMGLEWYTAIRRAFLAPDADDEARDESRWVPDPLDEVLRHRITVTEDGGWPHLVDGRPEHALYRPEARS